MGSNRGVPQLFINPAVGNIMSLSGSTDFTQTRDELITDVLTLLGVLGSGQTPIAADVSFCSNMLNKMLKAWEIQGIHLWKESEAIVALVPGQSRYSLNATGDRAGDPYVETELSVDAASSSTALTVVSTVGMTAADIIGISLTAGTLHWTTIVSIDSATTLTITTGLASPAASGRTVITYTTILAQPLKIKNCRYHYPGGTERKLLLMGRADYMNLTDKSTPGASTAYYYSPQLSTGYLYIYPTPADSNSTLHISYLKSIQDMDAAGNNFDLPQEWLEIITFSLAMRVAPAFGIVLSKVNPDIIQMALDGLDKIQRWDFEEGSIKIVPNYRYDS